MTPSPAWAWREAKGKWHQCLSVSASGSSASKGSWHTGHWHTLATVTWSRAKTGAWPSSQEKLAGETWCLLTLVGTAGGPWWPHRTGPLLLLLWCWLQTDTRGIGPEDVQDWSAASQEKKNTQSNPPKKHKRKPKMGASTCTASSLWQKPRSKREPRGKRPLLGRMTFTLFLHWLLLHCPVVLVHFRPWKKQWQFWVQIDIGYNNNLGYPGHWPIWFLNFYLFYSSC